MSHVGDITTPPLQRVDPAGRPPEGRARQAIIAFSIIVGWVGLIVLIMWSHSGMDPVQPARILGGVGLITWAACEMFGGREGPIWPISALAVTGALSIGYTAGLMARSWYGTSDFTGMAIICGFAAMAMLAFMFRFRLPGLVSPTITFSVVALFITLYGVNQETLSQIEGISPRGILAALIREPWVMALVGALGGAAVVLARRLDLNGDEFGIASARPLHLVGAGVTALVLGRVLLALPMPLDMIALAVAWIGAFYWSLRINRIAVLIAIHFAIAKPLMLAFMTPLGWTPDVTEWSVMLTIIFFFDLAIWPRVHRVAMAHDWILGPGGRAPRPRNGWAWRYWPYA